MRESIQVRQLPGKNLHAEHNKVYADHVIDVAQINVRLRRAVGGNSPPDCCIKWFKSDRLQKNIRTSLRMSLYF